MARSTEVAIIGAGPYGLSLAAHLAPKHVDFRLFGEPMDTWSSAMPKGMSLKSEGFASNLSDPDGKGTLEAYCAAHGLAYKHQAFPIPLETFIAYGQDFQRRFAPMLEKRRVARLSRSGSAFALTMEDGEQISAGKVVVAAGIREYAFLPAPLKGLPEDLATHACAHADLSKFAGKRVIVIGAGASAIDIAALLLQHRAAVTVVARGPELVFQAAPVERTLVEQLRRPMTGLGPSWKSFFACNAPLLVHALPRSWRIDFVKNHLGPAPCWFVRDQIEGKIKLVANADIEGAAPGADGDVTLRVRDVGGVRTELTADHIIAATGYVVDLTKLSFLDKAIVGALKYEQTSPALSAHFESSVPGLYFIGAPAANSFGPLLRFAYGAAYAARRLSHHLAASVGRGRVGVQHHEPAKAFAD